MSEKQKRDKDRRKMSELWQAIEPAKNEEIARMALDLAEHYLIKAENQARQIQNLERRNQPKRGKWITKSTNGEMFDCCSVCGYVEWNNPKNYCPNCGSYNGGNDDGDE